MHLWRIQAFIALERETYKSRERESLLYFFLNNTQYIFKSYINSMDFSCCIKSSYDAIAWSQHGEKREIYREFNNYLLFKL